MPNTIYLYLKTHNVTGLKYLGKTVQNPFEYKGSGLVWIRHLKKYGDDVTTEILFETTDMEEFKKVSLEYSKKWDIVDSKQFTNLIPEYGTGGDTSMCFTEETKEKIRTTLAKTRQGMDLSRSKETIEKIAKANRGKKRSTAAKEKMSRAAKKRGYQKNSGFKKGNTPWNKGKSEFMSNRVWVNNGVEDKRVYLNEIPNDYVLGRLFNPIIETFTCPHCDKIGKGAIMGRWHFDNCRSK